MSPGVTTAALVLAFCFPSSAHRLLRSRLPHHVDPTSDASSPLQNVEDIADPVEDIELRQKPPHVFADEISDNGGLLAADLEALLEENRDDMQDCIIIHQYAEPLLVGDQFKVHEAHLSRDDEVDLPPVVRQGAIWDDSATNDNLPLAVEMFAYLTGTTGLVQVIPHGPMAKWTSKAKVPLGGFLCSHSNHSVSAPVLHATPTPCVPTALGTEGAALGPQDGYEIFIGNTRLRFDNKTAASKFCLEYTRKISSDLARTTWDASSFGDLLPMKNPPLSSFVELTGKMTSPEGWTKGRKKLLVVVMDWKSGDNSLVPYSKQDSNPIPHYKSTIFPAVNAAFEQMSYGQFGVDVTFVPQVIRYTRERIRFTARKMPFPALYDAAKEAVEGQTSSYDFDSFDLVYVIAPQVKPTGTKGVAWVGMRGAMCNGCETISDNFKIMVAVHELGHNLGLLHASSTSLEYGNPFDWMGNYPDVVGLNYGVGYVWALGWLPQSSIYTISDNDLAGLSTVVVITPHDRIGMPTSGQIVGVVASLSANSRNLWVAYRSNPDGGRNGVFLTEQEKDEANSELIDAACHSPSQQDASLRVGWVYMDKSHRLGVKVLEVTETAAKVQLFEVKSSDVPKVYGLSTFTDGETKCPVTCQDADWLVTGYDCPTLKSNGYCKGGAITLQGTKYSIGLDICPQVCGRCEEVMKSTTTSVSSGCSNRNIKISGKSCSEVAAAGWCGYETRSGASVGKDLCPVSCGQCPKVVTPSGVPYAVPAPTNTVGTATLSAHEVVLEGPAPAPAPPQPADPLAAYLLPTNASVTPNVPSAPPGLAELPQETESDDDEEAEEDNGADSEEQESDEDNRCIDDPSWADSDGDHCKDYAKVVDDGTWSQRKACGYNEGAAMLFCRKTCGTCQPSSSTCADSVCISKFKEESGRCEQCSDWARFCKGQTARWFREECPLTCGVCRPNDQALRVAAPVLEAPPGNATKAGPTCSDEKCIEDWKTPHGCPKCSEFGDSFCSESVFASSCKKTCKLCLDGVVPDRCRDIFSAYTCGRYKAYGWCTRPDMRQPVSKQCAHTCGICTNNTQPPPAARKQSRWSSAPRPRLALAAVLAMGLGLTRTVA